MTNPNTLPDNNLNPDPQPQAAPAPTQDPQPEQGQTPPDALGLSEGLSPSVADAKQESPMTSGTTGGGLTPVAQKQLKRKRATRLTLEADARAIRAELGKGLGASEISARHGWSHNAYNRRMRVAEKQAKDEFGGDRIYRIFLMHEARFAAIQRDAREQAAEIKARLLDAIKNGTLDPRELAALGNVHVRSLKFIMDCQKEILKCAQATHITPSREEAEKAAYIDALYEENCGPGSEIVRVEDKSGMVYLFRQRDLVSRREKDADEG